MLKKCYRLKENKDFKRLYHRGRTAKNSYMVVYAMRNKKAGNNAACRIGFSVSKKLGGAVQRNQIKRRLRHAVMPYLPHENKAASGGFCLGYDYVIIARQAAAGAGTDKLNIKLGELLAAIHPQK